MLYTGNFQNFPEIFRQCRFEITHIPAHRMRKFDFPGVKQLPLRPIHFTAAAAVNLIPQNRKTQMVHVLAE